MNFIEIAKNRYSCRNYKSQKVEKQKLIELLEAARIAPSANNQQPWFFYIIQDDENLLNKIKQAYPRPWFESAPAAIVCCADTSKAWTRKSDGKNHAEIDVSIAIDHLTLQATSLGLATCWICNFDMNKVVEALNLPQNLIPIAILSLGYPNDLPDLERFTIKRKKLEEISKFM